MKSTELDLLKQLYAIHSPSGKEWPMITFLLQYLKTQVPAANVDIDTQGNLYVTKGDAEGGYPTLCCHMDQVQKKHSADFECIVEGDIIYGRSAASQRYEGLGADDKNGIWVALQCLRQCERLKVFFAVQEEIGLIGAHAARMEFFADSLYVLEPDMASGHELHSVLKGITACSPEFLAAIRYRDFNYMDNEGMGTDIYALKLRGLGVSCINIGTAYYRPHKDDEYTVLSELENCLNFVLHILKNTRERFPHSYKSLTQEMAEKYLAGQLSDK